MPEYVKVENEAPLAIVTVDRPKALNSLDTQVLEELLEVLEELEAQEDLRAVILTGAGERAFVAGADIGAMEALGPLEAEAHARRGTAVTNALEGSRLVTIAAVNGYALGGGLELAIACDLRLASENAELGLPEVGLGVIPGFGGTQRLPRLIGKGKALELILTGGRVGAAEAREMGLVNDVVAQEKLLDEARSLAGTILENGPVALRLAKEVVHEGLQTDLDRGLELEAKAFGMAFSTHDQEEGMRAFLEKRAPKWTGG